MPTTLEVWVQTTHAEEKAVAGKLFWRVHLHCEVTAQGMSHRKLEASREIQGQKRDARLPPICHAEIVLFSKADES